MLTIPREEEARAAELEIATVLASPSRGEDTEATLMQLLSAFDTRRRHREARLVTLCAIKPVTATNAS